MANRNRTDAALMLRQGDVSIPSKFLPSPKPQSSEKNDDLILTLSNAYENRRAQQVGEWEKLYGQNVYRAV